MAGRIRFPGQVRGAAGGGKPARSGVSGFLPACTGEQAEMVTTDNLVSALESMAYQPAEAKEMVRRAAPRLRADMTLEEAIRITLQMGKGGDQP